MTALSQPKVGDKFAGLYYSCGIACLWSTITPTLSDTNRKYTRLTDRPTIMYHIIYNEYNDSYLSQYFCYQSHATNSSLL